MSDHQAEIYKLYRQGQDRRLLVTGAILYVAWHAYEMYRRR